MRKTWLAVMPIVLLVWTPVIAQESRVGSVKRAKGETWAANHPAGMPAADLTPPVPVSQLPPAVQYYLQPASAPAPAAIGVPVVPAPAPAVGGCGGGDCDSGKHGWQKLRDWLCYRSIRGGCPKRGSCGCNCSTPLYLYFIHDCTEGRKYELPPPCDGCGKGVAAQLLEGTRRLIHSAAPARSEKCYDGAATPAHPHPIAQAPSGQSCPSAVTPCGYPSSTTAATRPPSSHSCSSVTPCCNVTGKSCPSGCVEGSGHRLFGQPTGHQGGGYP